MKLSTVLFGFVLAPFVLADPIPWPEAKPVPVPDALVKRCSHPSADAACNNACRSVVAAAVKKRCASCGTSPSCEWNCSQGIKRNCSYCCATRCTTCS